MEKEDNTKHDVSLKFINTILVNLGKEKIKELTDFKDIDREDIIKDVNKESLKKMEDELYNHFNKKKCGYYRQNETKHYILTFLRHLCADLNLSFTYYKKDITEVINSKNYRKTHVYYSIVKK